MGYVGITGNTFKKKLDVDFKLYTLDIDQDNNPTFVIDLTKDNSETVENNFFDVVICTEVLEHTKNPIACLDELYRMLKPKFTRSETGKPCWFILLGKTGVLKLQGCKRKYDKIRYVKI